MLLFCFCFENCPRYVGLPNSSVPYTSTLSNHAKFGYDILREVGASSLSAPDFTERLLEHYVQRLGAPLCPLHFWCVRGCHAALAPPSAPQPLSVYCWCCVWRVRFDRPHVACVYSYSTILRTHPSKNFIEDRCGGRVRAWVLACPVLGP